MMKICHPLDLCSEPPAFVRSCGGSSVLVGHNTLMEFNLSGYPFPGWSEARDRRTVAEAILPALDRIFPSDEWVLQAEVQQLTREERMLLFEREQLTSTMAAREDGVHVLLNRAQDTCVFINDEEHLLIQTYHPGGLEDLKRAREVALADQQRFLKHLPVAFNKKAGMLFSDPYKSGEGVWVAALVYLPGIMQTYRNYDLADSMSELGILCLPALSHTKNEKGDMYWLCSPTTQDLGDDATYDAFFRTIHELCDREEEARHDIMRNTVSLHFLHNEMDSAFATLTKKKSLSYRDLLHAFSMLRIGLAIGKFTTDTPVQKVHQLIARAYTEALPTYLQLARNGRTRKERRALRASIIKSLINDELRIHTHSIEEIS